MRRGSSFATLAAVCLLFTALTLAFAHPLVTRLGSSLFKADSDGFFILWTLSWDVHAFIHQPLALFDANIYYPEQDTLAYSESLIGSALFAAPIIWITHNPVLASNLVALLSCILCGVGAYVLARELEVSTPGALVSSLIFAFAPPRFLRIDQMHLTTVQWVPFCLAALHAYFKRGRPRDLRIAVALLTLQVLTSGHGTIFLAVAGLALIAYHLMAGAPLALERRARDLGIAGACLLVPALLIVQPYLTVQSVMGLRRTLDDAISFASFFDSPSYVHSYLLSLMPRLRVAESAEAELFPGILPIVLALAACCRPGARRGPTALYGFIAVISFWLAIGPPFGIWRFVYWIPGLNFIRAPSRFTILEVLGLAMLAGFGFDRLTRRLTARGLAAAGLLVSALLVGELAVPLCVEPFVFEIPALDRWVASQPVPFVVAELPLEHPHNEWRHAAYMLHSTAHWQKTIHGYSGFRPPAHEALYRQMIHLPDQDSVTSLRELGVTYLIVHADLYVPQDWARVKNRFAQVPALTLVHEEACGRVYRIEAIARAGVQ